MTDAFNVPIRDKGSTKDVNIQEPQGISSAISNYIVRSVNLNPNVKSRV